MGKQQVMRGVEIASYQVSKEGVVSFGTVLSCEQSDAIVRLDLYLPKRYGPRILQSKGKKLTIIKLLLNRVCPDDAQP